MSQVTQQPDDGHGWYIIERNPGGARTLRYWVRYNLKCAAEAEARFKFPNEDVFVMYWDGSWHDDKPVRR